jgi:hypothetical protein
MNGSNSSIVPSSRGFKAAWTGVDSISVCDVRVRPMTSNGHQAKRPRGAPFNVASFPWARPPSNSRWFSACLYRRTRIGACGRCVGLARAERAMTARASCRIRMAVHHGVGCFGCQRPVSSTADRECVDGPADALALEQAELNRRPEMDPAVQPGQGRLSGGMAEGVEPAGRQPALVMRVVDEGVAATEQIAEDRGRGAGLNRVPRWVLGERRRVQSRRPGRVDQIADVGDRPDQVVSVFGVPARR